MAQFIRINGTRINVERINHYSVYVKNREYTLIIVFGQADEIRYTTEDKHELESWLKALGEE